MLETISRNFVRSLLPPSWLVEDVGADYGTDLRVEIVEDDKPTGLHFLIQVKAHNSAQSQDGAMQEDLDVGHLLYYQRLVLPVILVVYDDSTRRASYINLKNYMTRQLSVENPGWESQQRVRVQIPTTDDLANGTTVIASEVKAFFQEHGLLRDSALSPSWQKIIAPILREMALRYPERSSFSSLYRGARRHVSLKRRGRGNIARIREAIRQVAEIEDARGRTFIKMAEPSHAKLFLALNLVDDSNLVAFLDSPWAMAIGDVYVCAFVLAIRAQHSSALVVSLNAHSFRFRDLYFALLEELLVVDQSVLARLRGVIVDSVIRAQGDQTVNRGDVLRLVDSAATEAYVEYQSRRGSNEWSEFVVGESYHGIVRVRGPVPTPPGTFTARTFQRTIGKGTYVLSVAESKLPVTSDLVGVSFVRKNQPDQAAILTAYSTATHLGFRGDILESMTILAGQNVRTSALEGDFGVGFRLTIDGVPIMDTWLGVEFARIDLPPDVRASLESAGRSRREPRIVFRKLLSNVQGKEELEGVEQLLAVARRRHGASRQEVG